MSNNADPYATALSELRATAKWLASIFSGAAGVVLAGATFSNLGALEITHPRFQIALVGLVSGVFFLLLAARIIVPVLTPTELYASELRDCPSRWHDGIRARELRKLRKIIATHKDLLPKGLDTPDTLLDRRARLSVEVCEARKQGSAGLSALQEEFNDLDRHVRSLLYFGKFQLAYIRFRYRLDAMIFAGLCALGGLVVFTWAANPPDPPAADTCKPAACLSGQAYMPPCNPFTPLPTASLRCPSRGPTGVP